MPSAVEAILFDMNGTLRAREAHEPTQRAALARLQEWIEREAIDLEELTRRYNTYRDWAQANLIPLPEAEIWSRWMLPGISSALVEPGAAELMLAWSERKGHTIPVNGADTTLTALRERGYRLGVISNSMSTLDIPRSLEAFGWKDYFDVVILSSTLRIRKPSPEPFLEAARRLHLPPGHCAYVGNRVSKDIVGCKRAGFALGLIIEPVSRTRLVQNDQAVTPDIVIHNLSELLDIFPGVQ